MWVKVDDGFTDHPKIEALSDRAFRLHVAGMCFCGRTLSDGFIPTDRVRRLLPKVTAGMVQELVANTVWLEREDGFEVKDYLVYNPSKEKVMADREAAADRKRKWQEKNAVKNGERNASRNAAPSRPDPARPEGSRAEVSEEPSAMEPPAPAADGGAGSQERMLPQEQVELNVDRARAAREALKAKVAS